MSCKKKGSIFRIFIELKLLFVLSACCLIIAQQRRLNRFQSRCLRAILCIKPAYLSRISNKVGFGRAVCEPMTDILTAQKLLFLGRALRAPNAALLRCCSFVFGTDRPLVLYYIRRTGRPRKEWVPTVMDAAHRRNNMDRSLRELAQDGVRWRQVMCQKQPR